jgi:hypothetical protein
MSTEVRNDCPIRKPNVWLRKTDSEIAMYDPGGSQVHLLNDTALAIWELCDGHTTPSEMISAICELCDMHRDIVTEDVERILSDFDSAGLVSWES